MSTPEQLVKNAILDWLSWRRECVYWVNDSVGIWDKEKNCYRKRNTRHARLGVSDIILCWLGEFVAIEVKSKTGRPTPDQLKFQSDIHSVNGKAFFARSVDDVISQFKEWRFI